MKQFRQAVLATATAGALTEDWRGSKNTVNWNYETAEEICEKVQSGGTPKKGFVSTPGIPFLKIYNIVNQKINFEHRPQFITNDIHKSSLLKSQTLPGDVVMNIVGPPLGKVAIIPDSFSEWNLNQAITLFRPSGLIITKWIYYFLCTGNSIAEIAHETRGSAGQVNISLSQCRAFVFPVPPLPEQLEIVSRVETLFALADDLETRISTARNQLEKLTPALLAKAFRGELVPQDPKDEPASVLLERIQAARELQPTTKPERKPRTPRTKTLKAGGEPVKRLEDVPSDYLTQTIKEREPDQNALEAKTLWQASDLSIDDFYQQLSREVLGGLLRVNGDQPAIIEAA